MPEPGQFLQLRVVIVIIDPRFEPLDPFGNPDQAGHHDIHDRPDTGQQEGWSQAEPHNFLHPNCRSGAFEQFGGKVCA